MLDKTKQLIIKYALSIILIANYLAIEWIGAFSEKVSFSEGFIKNSFNAAFVSGMLHFSAEIGMIIENFVNTKFKKDA